MSYGQDDEAIEQHSCTTGGTIEGARGLNVWSLWGLPEFHRPIPRFIARLVSERLESWQRRDPQHANFREHDLSQSRVSCYNISVYKRSEVIMFRLCHSRCTVSRRAEESARASIVPRIKVSRAESMLEASLPMPRTRSLKRVRKNPRPGYRWKSSERWRDVFGEVEGHYSKVFFNGL